MLTKIIIYMFSKHRSCQTRERRVLARRSPTKCCQGDEISCQLGEGSNGESGHRCVFWRGGRIALANPCAVERGK